MTEDEYGDVALAVYERERSGMCQVDGQQIISYEGQSLPKRTKLQLAFL